MCFLIAEVHLLMQPPSFCYAFLVTQLPSLICWPPCSLALRIPETTRKLEAKINIVPTVE